MNAETPDGTTDNRMDASQPDDVEEHDYANISDIQVVNKWSS